VVDSLDTVRWQGCRQFRYCQVCRQFRHWKRDRGVHIQYITDEWKQKCNKRCRCIKTYYKGPVSFLYIMLKTLK